MGRLGSPSFDAAVLASCASVDLPFSPSQIGAGNGVEQAQPPFVDHGGRVLRAVHPSLRVQQRDPSDQSLGLAKGVGQGQPMLGQADEAALHGLNSVLHHAVQVGAVHEAVKRGC